MPTSQPSAPSTGFLVWRLSLRWQVQLSRALAPLGITHTDYAVLASLRGLARSGLRPSQRELADVSGLEPMYVSKLARALEGAGLVERRPHRGDPRAIELSLTDRGTEVVTAGRQVVRDLEEQRLATLGGASSRRAAQFKEALAELLDEAQQPELRSTTRKEAQR
jgi:MarR family transcriptional regulator, organic hydroperoxide resistance regulator